MHQVSTQVLTDAHASHPKKGPSSPLCVSKTCRRDPETGVLRPRVRDSASRICRSCHERLRRSLAELPGLYEECERALAHPPLQLAERTSGTRGTGIPLNMAAVNARYEMMSVLSSWAALVTNERDVHAPRRTHRDLASFLTTHQDWLVAHPAAAEFTDEVASLARSAARAARSNPIRRMDLGPCVHPGCDSVMYSPVRVTDEQLSRDVRCDAGHAWPSHQWLLLARRLKELKQSDGSAQSADHAAKREALA
ncbi:OvmZ protein [Streptomyces sp. bgisy091]|uniref:OvmZ protein n=1 Tax=Streptomyces sp. bgisy091 TaxID=3413778 RepID=UPI003D72BF5F